MNDKTLAITIKANDRASKVLAKVGDATERAGSRISAVGGTLARAGIAVAAALGTAGVAAGGFAIKSAAGLEQTHTAFTTMLKDSQKAGQLMEELNKFAAETPFEFPELADAGKKLLAFGFAAQDIQPNLRRLGDIASGLGIPIGELSELYGKARVQGRLYMEDVNQLTGRGIPIIAEFAKQFGVTEDKVRGLVEEGKIGFPELQKAVENMTNAGGMFEGGMARQAQTLSGLFSTLKDNIGAVARDFVGMSASGEIVAGGLFDRIRNSVARIIEIMPGMVASFKENVAAIMPTLQQWADNIVNVGNQIANYLEPKLTALWNTIQTNVMPVLTRLWKEVLEPLIPVIGAALVFALGAAMDAANIFLIAISAVTSWLLDNKGVVVIFAGALGGLATALGIQAAVTAFTTAMATIRGAIVLTQATLLAPMVLPAIAVGAALASIAVVIAAIRSVRDALNALDQSAQATLSNHRAEIDAQMRLDKLIRTGSPEQRARASRTYNSLYGAPTPQAAGQFASGGFTGRGGTNDVAGIVHKGEYVVPKNQVDQSTGKPMNMGGTTINISGTINIQTPEAATAFWDRVDQTARLSRMGMA